MDESLMDAVVSASGSSPAYVYMMIEAMADAAVKAGMPRQAAYKICAAAVEGSAAMVLHTGTHPGQLKDMVCSPGGTTIDAVEALEADGFRYAVMDAMAKCTEKSKFLRNKEVEYDNNKTACIPSRSCQQNPGALSGR